MKLTRKDHEILRSTVLMRSGIVTFVLLLASLTASGQTGWNPVASGTMNNLRGVSFASAGTGVIVGDAGQILRSIDGGVTWASVASGVTEDLNDVALLNNNKAIAVGDRGTLIQSLDAGLTWATPAGGIIQEKFSAVSFESAGLVGIVAGDQQTILRTTDGGGSWSTIQTGFFGEFQGASIATGGTGTVCGVNSIFQPLAGRTTDAGVSWSFNAFYLDGNEGTLNDIHTLNAQTAVAAAELWDGTGAVTRTTNGGADWLTTLFPRGLEAVTFATGAVGFVAGMDGTILKSTDNGVSWDAQISGTQETLRDVFFLDSLYGFAVGDGGTILRTTTGGVITSAELPAPPHPKEFTLLQNYPNPFNPETVISFELPFAGYVSVVVLDVLGREVATLVDRRMDAGKHSVTWNADGMSSGVYYLRMESDGFRQVRNMVKLE